jgi:hypothetical protein
LIAHSTAFERCASVAAGAFAGAPARRAADAAIYLAHVEGAAPLRRIAVASGRALSSVHRAVRRIEALRDDPLLDLAIEALGEALGEAARTDLHTETPNEEAALLHDPQPRAEPSPPSQAYAERLAQRALMRLAEPESFLMVARGAERAGVFCRKNRFRRPLVLMPVAQAVTLAARDWVRCVSRTEASAKYAITAMGRAWLRRQQAEAEAREAPVIGSAEAPTPFAAQHAERGERLVARADGRIETIRVNLGESPLGWLSRRRGSEGTPFLAPEEVEAGERLREDFEVAQTGPRIAQDWRAFLVPRDGHGRPGSPAEGPRDARDRLASALEDLGPGLADVALRACCYLEGLEATERRMGWAARSGKVVLKIALQRLAAHYGLAPGPAR